MSELPPGVVEENGKLFRYVTRTSGDGSERQQRRPVSLDFREARTKRYDFYHEGLQTWVLEGVKQEKDRTSDSIIGDASTSIPVPAGEGVHASVSESSGSEEGETDES